MISEKGTFWLPHANSTVAGEVDGLFYFIYWTSVISMVLLMGATAYSVWTYRRREGGPPVKQYTHNSIIELAWSIIPGLVLLVIFFWGFKGYMNIALAPGDSMEVHVTARQWSWQFTYPNGVSSQDLHVPVGRPVKLIMNSTDVLHSFFVPEFRVKQDVIPGRYSSVWFEALETGEMQIYCTEYCGTDHSAMLAKAFVHEQEEYDAWLQKEVDALAAESTPEDLGKRLFVQKACIGCHSLDGSPKPGPTFKGLFGRQEKLSDGSSVLVDENYIRESLMEPQAKIVAGFQPVMPTFQGQLKDNEVDGLIAYIKTIQ